MREGGATEPSLDFSGDTLQEIVTVNGLSTPVTASSLSETKCSVEEDATQGVAVDDSADIPDRCASEHYYSEQASCVDVWLGFRSGVGAES